MSGVPERTEDARAVAVVERLYAAYNRHDLEAVLACWRDGGVEYLPLVGEMRAPNEIGGHLRGFYAAFPDAAVQVQRVVVGADGRVAAQVQLSGTFTGGRFQGLRANGRPWKARMAEFFEVEDGLIVRMDAYLDGMELGRQLQLLPPEGSGQERLLRALFNTRVAVTQVLARRREARP